MNVTNLRKLAAGLRGPLKAEFHMSQFSSANNDDDVTDNCGTAACALGHSLYLVEPLLSEHEAFANYSRRVYDMEWNSREWAWCFGGSWSVFDNTPEGAAERIEYMLDHGVPSTFDKLSNKTNVAIYKGYVSHATE